MSEIFLSVFSALVYPRHIERLARATMPFRKAGAYFRASAAAAHVTPTA